MPRRYSLPLILLLACLLTACGTTPGGTAPSRHALRCKRKGFAIAYNPPPGWTGPVYASGPALDSWTFSTGPAAAPTMLETRVYDAKDSPLRWDTASDAQILANFKATYQNPRVERVASVPVNGGATVVRAIHTVGVEELLANVYYGDNLVSIICTANTPEALGGQRTAVLAFLASLSFEKIP